MLNASLNFVHYNAISVEFLDFELPAHPFDYIIFTSQNAVKAFLNKSRQKAGQGEGHEIKDAFCVGEKTKSLLLEHGFNVIEMAKNALELGKIITKTYKNRSFLFFSGDLRRNELPKLLTEHQVQFEEVSIYKTLPNPKKFDQYFDGILFFSPSAVDSFVKENTLGEATVFCIGETTASEAKKYTDKIIISNKPTIENVIVQAVKHL